MLNVLFLCTSATRPAASHHVRGHVEPPGRAVRKAWPLSGVFGWQQPRRATARPLDVLCNAGPRPAQRKGWDSLWLDAPHMDLIITVCDNAAGRVPIWSMRIRRGQSNALPAGNRHAHWPSTGASCLPPQSCKSRLCRTPPKSVFHCNFQVFQDFRPGLCCSGGGRTARPRQFLQPMPTGGARTAFSWSLQPRQLKAFLEPRAGRPAATSDGRVLGLSLTRRPGRFQPQR